MWYKLLKEKLSALVHLPVNFVLHFTKPTFTFPFCPPISLLHHLHRINIYGHSHPSFPFQFLSALPNKFAESLG